MKLMESIDEYVINLDDKKRALVKGDLEQYRDYLITTGSDGEDKIDFIMVDDMEEGALIDFIGDYLLRKVELSQKNYTSVLKNFKNFFTFLKDSGSISEEKTDKLIKILDYYIAIIPQLKEFERKLTHYIENSLGTLKGIGHLKSSFVTIEDVKNNELWLDSMADKRKIGPFVLPEEICKLARKGFSFECEYGEIDNKYYFIFVSNVYPEGFGF